MELAYSILPALPGHAALQELAYVQVPARSQHHLLKKLLLPFVHLLEQGECLSWAGMVLGTALLAGSPLPPLGGDPSATTVSSSSHCPGRVPRSSPGGSHKGVTKDVL